MVGSHVHSPFACGIAVGPIVAVQYGDALAALDIDERHGIVDVALHAFL